MKSSKPQVNVNLEGESRSFRLHRAAFPDGHTCFNSRAAHNRLHHLHLSTALHIGQVQVSKDGQQVGELLFAFMRTACWSVRQAQTWSLPESLLCYDMQRIVIVLICALIQKSPSRLCTPGGQRSKIIRKRVRGIPCLRWSEAFVQRYFITDQLVATMPG